MIKPAVGLAKLLPALWELEALKKELGVVVPPGARGPGKPHALKLVNTFFGFEVRWRVGRGGVEGRILEGWWWGKS